MSFSIKDMNENQFVDLFGDGKEVNDQSGTSFGMKENNADLFSSTTDTTTLPPSTTDTTTQAPAPLEEVDLLGEDGKPKAKEGEGDDGKGGPGRPPKYDFTEMSGYFKDRIDKNLFVPLEIENEKGETVLFEPKTPEEFDEFISYQVEYKLESEKKELDKAWYEGKSPAWQFIAQFSEKIQDPRELLPVLQGVQTIQSIASIDETQIEGAEQLVRYQLEIAKTPKALIDKQIEALKSTNQILDAAKDLKPELVKIEQQKLAELDKQKEQELNNYRNMVVDIRNKAVKVIESPIGKEKLKQEEKAAVYELIAVPNPQTRGYSIFDKIDELFDKGDFDKLRKIALLLTNEEAFVNYVSAEKVDKVGGDILRKIRVAGEKVTSKSEQETPNNTPSKTNQNRVTTGRSLFSRGQ